MHWHVSPVYGIQSREYRALEARIPRHARQKCWGRASVHAGGANLDLVYDMMSGVQEHVRFVNAETITRLALERGI